MLHSAIAYQDNLKVVDFSSSAKHRRAEWVFRVEPRGDV
jgi:hypothetical protein